MFIFFQCVGLFVYFVYDFNNNNNSQWLQASLPVKEAAWESDVLFRLHYLLF